MLLVDTNVLVDVLQNDPQWADWSIAQLRAQAPDGHPNSPAYGRLKLPHLS